MVPANEACLVYNRRLYNFFINSAYHAWQRLPNMRCKCCRFSAAENLWPFHKQICTKPDRAFACAEYVKKIKNKSKCTKNLQLQNFLCICSKICNNQNLLWIDTSLHRYCADFLHSLWRRSLCCYCKHCRFPTRKLGAHECKRKKNLNQ